MKKLITLAAITVASLFTISVLAQPMVSKAVLENNYIQNIQTKADGIKSNFENEGFVLSTSSAMTMESNNELPVILSFKAGTNYRIVFIGENTSSSCDMNLVDINNKQVTFTKKSNENNVITHEYSSANNEYHMIKPVQTNNSSKKISGYFMVFKKN